VPGIKGSHGDTGRAGNPGPQGQPGAPGPDGPKVRSKQYMTLHNLRGIRVAIVTDDPLFPGRRRIWRTSRTARAARTSGSCRGQRITRASRPHGTQWSEGPSRGVSEYLEHWWRTCWTHISAKRLSALLCQTQYIRGNILNDKNTFKFEGDLLHITASNFL